MKVGFSYKTSIFDNKNREISKLISAPSVNFDHLLVDTSFKPKNVSNKIKR